MNIKIHGKNNFEISDRIKDYITKRVEKLNYFESHLGEINFNLEAKKVNYKINAICTIHKLGTFKFEASASDMYTAIDKVVHKIDGKIIREKSKMQKHNKWGHQEVADYLNEKEAN